MEIDVGWNYQQTVVRTFINTHLFLQSSSVAWSPQEVVSVLYLA